MKNQYGNKINVAGARFARASQGYEPRELLLLYPAATIISHFEQ